jgi:hypothetical protein
MALGLKRGGWQGVAEAFKDWEREELEERRFERQLLEQRRNTLVPYLTKAHQANLKSQSEAKSVLSFFNNRLTDSSEAEKKAFMNIIRDNPEMGKSIYSAVLKNEDKYPGLELKGSKLVQFSNVIEYTKPEGMSIEDWTSEAASRVYESNANTISEMLESVLGAEDLDTMPTLVDVLEATATDPGISGGLPDFRSPVGMRPEEEKKYMDAVYITVEAELNRKIADLNQQITEREGLNNKALSVELTRLQTLKSEADDNPINVLFEFKDLTQSILTSMKANDPYIESSNLFRTFMKPIGDM